MDSLEVLKKVTVKKLIIVDNFIFLVPDIWASLRGTKIRANYLCFLNFQYQYVSGTSFIAIL